MRAASYIVLVLAGSYALALNVDDPGARLMHARSLRCRFRGVSTTVWKQQEAPQTTNTAYSENVQFDAIDLKKGTARIIGNAPSAAVSVFASPMAGLNFVEQALEVFDTTIVAPGHQRGTSYLAIRIVRTAQSQNETTTRQYRGLCQIWEWQ